MNRWISQLAAVAIVAVSVALSISAQAATPVERGVQSVRTVQVYSPEGHSVSRPIGSIDFSSSGSASRRFGPWSAETDAFRNADGVIFYDDGSASGRSLERHYQRGNGSGCTTLGNVTVCR